MTDTAGDTCSGTGPQTCSGIQAEHGGKGHDLNGYLVAGAAAADFDRDGWVDVFVSWDFTALYQNQDGAFVELQSVGLPANLDADTPGGLWFDYDNDGDLDLLFPVAAGWRSGCTLMIMTAA